MRACSTGLQFGRGLADALDGTLKGDRDLPEEGGVPYSIRGHLPGSMERKFVVIFVYLRDVVVRRVGAWIGRMGGGRRGPIRTMSDRSRRSLLFNLRNTPGLNSEIVLIYGSKYLGDGRILKRTLLLL